MRILYLGIGDAPAARALPQSWPDRLFDRRVGRHEVVTFGYRDGVDIRIPIGAPFSNVLERLPGGWTPDACVCLHADHLLVAPGIEHAPFPTVAVTADWDFRLATARHVASTFDLVVTLGDASCRAMETLGARHTLPFAYFGVPEGELAGDLAPIDRERPIDILFSGTINDRTHLDRSQWLLRLARISHRHRIVIAQPDSSQDAYRELLQSSKLVFTFHRRGELQLRFTDAVTQGAAVLDCGVETARHYRPGVEYVAFTDGDFERVVEDALADPDKRRSIVEAARARTRDEFGSVRRLELLFDRLEDWIAERDATPARPAGALPDGELALRHAEQLYTSHFDSCLGPDGSYLPVARSAIEGAKPGARRENDTAVIELAIDSSRVTPSGEANGISRLERLVSACPDQAIAHYNLGMARRARRDFEAAITDLGRARDLLLDEGAAFDPWALLVRDRTPEYRAFLRTWHDALFAMLRTGDETEPRRVLAAECLHAIAVMQNRLGRTVDCCENACLAATLAPDRGDFAKAAALATDLLGLVDEARTHVERATSLLPFDVPWRLRALAFLGRNGHFDTAQALLAETIDLFRTVHPSETFVEELRRTTSELRHARAGTPIASNLLADQFAMDAIRELCDHVDRHPDPRIERRIDDLVRALRAARPTTALITPPTPPSSVQTVPAPAPGFEPSL